MLALLCPSLGPPLQINYLTFWASFTITGEFMLALFALTNRSGDDFTAIRYFPQWQTYINS